MEAHQPPRVPGPMDRRHQSDALGRIPNCTRRLSMAWPVATLVARRAPRTGRGEAGFPAERRRRCPPHKIGILPRIQIMTRSAPVSRQPGRRRLRSFGGDAVLRGLLRPARPYRSPGALSALSAQRPGTHDSTSKTAAWRPWRSASSSMGPLAGRPVRPHPAASALVEHRPGAVTSVPGLSRAAA